MLLQLSGRSPMSCDGNTLWDITPTPPGRLVSSVRLKYVSISRTWSSELATATSTLRQTHQHQTQRPPTLSPNPLVSLVLFVHQAALPILLFLCRDFTNPTFSMARGISRFLMNQRQTLP